MIIAVCTDDQQVVTLVANASNGNRAIFGLGYRVFDKNIPALGKNEDLFLVAHGAKEADEDQPVIGSAGNAFYLTPRDLNSNLHVFPNGYTGRVFVYACESADGGRDGRSFVQAFKDIIARSFPSISVFGQCGKPNALAPVPLPTDPSWVRAN